MTFAGMNYLAIIIAAVAGWLVGAGWYTALAKPWVAAQGKTMDEFKREAAEGVGQAAAMLPFIIALAANLVMAWVLAGVVGHLGPGQVTLRNGIISAAFLWVGFVLTTQLVNHAFQGRRYKLAAIDGGHWLAVMLIQGAIIGAFGV